MDGIVGSVNYNVSIDGQFFKTRLTSGGAAPYRINNVMMLNTFRIDGIVNEIERANANQNFTIVYCGKLTNFNELAEKFDLDAINDASMLLSLFAIKGLRMLEELKGVFAFALYDINNRRLFLVRDQSEYKPLYLYVHAGKFVFSSELNMVVGLTKTRVDYKSLARFIYSGGNYQNSTPYESIVEIENGHCLVIDTLTGTYDNVCWCRKQQANRQRNIIC